MVVSNPEESFDKNESKIAVPMVGKPKLSGTDGKKHRIVEPKTTDSLAALFSTPIKIAKVSPENKKTIDKASYHKTLTDKPDKSEKLSKTKHSPHKDSKREKNGEEKKEKRDKDQTKEKERSKEKSKKPTSPSNKSSYQSSSSKRPQSPVAMKKQPSPLDTSNIRKSASPKIREKDHKKTSVDKEKDKDKIKDNSKVALDESKSDKKKKKHRDEKEIERKEKLRDKEREKVKEMKSSEKKNIEKLIKHDKHDKDKSQETKPPKDIKKSPKSSKETERSNSKIRSEKSEMTEKVKDTTRNEKERQKHKHRKKEKKERTDESKDRDKRDKRDKQVNSYEKDGATSAPPTSNPLSTLLAEVHEHDSSDSANSADEEDSKTLTSCKAEQKPARNATSDSRLSRPLSPSGAEHIKRERSEKMKKDKLKPLRGDERDTNRKRKRRSDSKGADDETPAKREKDSDFSPPLEPVSSSQSPVTVEMAAGYTAKESDDAEHHAVKQQDFEIEPEQIAPDSTNSILVESESDEPLVFSDDYVSQLKDLQHKIMTLQDNQELQRVVQVIAATGQYEITRKTFDFDLCALDRRTVQRLQQFFSAS